MTPAKALQNRLAIWQRIKAAAEQARDQYQGDIDTAKAEIWRIEAEIEKEKTD